MINQKRIDGLLKYMAELGQQQMIIRNPLLIKYLLGYAPRGGDRATILYVSQTNGIKLIANYLTTWPKGLEDEIEIVDTLLSGRTVLINMEGLNIELAQRIIDFTSGSCFAIGGNLQKISHYIFIITPAIVDISGDFQEILSGSFDVPINNGL